MSERLTNDELTTIRDVSPMDAHWAHADLVADMAAELLEQRSRVAAFEAQLNRVREVHEPIEALNVRYNQLTRVCSGCGTDDGNWQIYPCPTIRALEVKS